MIGSENKNFLIKISPSPIEYQDIVYRDEKRKSEKYLAPKRAKVDSEWFREVVPDKVLLLRYSALTFKRHRIHHDRKYATEEESYPSLVFHGPLLATLLRIWFIDNFLTLL